MNSDIIHSITYAGDQAVITDIDRHFTTYLSVAFEGGSMTAPELVIVIREESKYGATEDIWRINRN